MEAALRLRCPRTSRLYQRMLPLCILCHCYSCSNTFLLHLQPALMLQAQSAVPAISLVGSIPRDAPSRNQAMQTQAHPDKSHFSTPKWKAHAKHRHCPFSHLEMARFPRLWRDHTGGSHRTQMTLRPAALGFAKSRLAPVIFLSWSFQTLQHREEMLKVINVPVSSPRAT